MKKLLALLCVFALMLTFCGCRETKVEESVLSYVDGEEIQAGNNTVAGDKETSSKTENKKEDDDKSNAGDKGTNDAVVNTGSNSNIADPLKPNLKGAKIVIYDAGGCFTANATSSKTDKAKADMLKKIQKELNCKFEVKTVDLAKLSSLAATSAASGKAIGGIITTRLYESGFYISSNLVANITKISSLDLSKDYMHHADMPNASQFGKGKYLLSGSSVFGNGVFFNKRILKEIGMTDKELYKLVDDGKWTYSKMRSIAKKANKDLDGKSGMSANDQWGIVVRDYDTANTADVLVSSNTPMIKLVNGKLKLNTTDSNIVKMANLLKDVKNKDGIMYNDARGQDAVKFFKAGKALFFYANTQDAIALTSMKDEYGFIVAPKVDGAKSYKTAIDWNASVMMIPAGLSAQDQYNAGAVVQAYQYLKDDVFKAAEKEFANRYFCDDESGKNMLMVLNNQTSQPAQCYAKANETILTGTYRIFWNYLGSASTAPSSAIESTKVSTQKALDDLNKKIKDK